MKKYTYIFFLTIACFVFMKAQTLSVSFSKNEHPCLLAQASITINTGVSPIQILWSTGATTNAVEQLAVGDYSVKVTDNNSKDTTIYFSIESVACFPSVENHFTPNNDDYNDTWDIYRIEYFPNFELFVYNRWGQLVHHQENEFKPWDGKSLTIPSPDAPYYYILFLDKSNKKDVIKGDVNIIR